MVRILRAEISEHSVCSIFIGVVSKENNWDKIVWVLIQVKVWLKTAWANEKEWGQGWGLS
jgi:hypothetical protein